MRKPLLILDGEIDRRCISVLEFDSNDMGVRIHVLSHSRGTTAGKSMRRRFDHMLELMGDNVDHEIRFSTQEDAEEEADALNSDEQGPVTWQTAYVNDDDEGYWIVEAVEDDEDGGYGGRDTPSPENAWGG